MELTKAENQEEQALADAFHLMWDSFPEPVQLAHKSYRVVAVNPAMGGKREPGTLCAPAPGKPHPGCLAAESMEVQAPRWVQMKGKEEGQKSVTFWLPIAGHADYYIHFAQGMFVDYSQPNG